MTVESESRPGPDELRALWQWAPERLAELLETTHEADVADFLQELSGDDAHRIYRTMSAEARARVLEYASEPLREELLARLSVPEVVEVVEELPADVVVDLLALTDDDRTEEILRGVDLERAKGLRRLAAHEADTAGGLMTHEFLAVPLGTHIGDVIKGIRQEGEEVDESTLGVFVVDEERRPVGFISDRDLLTHPIHSSVDEHMDTDLVTVREDEDQEDVAQAMYKYGVAAIPVVDESGTLTGVVTADDLSEVLVEEAEEDILRLVGTAPVEQTRLPVWKRATQRLPLQGLTVVGGLVTAWILARTLPGGGGEGEGADLLRYIPIIIGLAGNVGIQASTILVRAFATGEVQPDREASVLASEVAVGLLIGILCGAVTATVSAFLEAGSEPAFHFAASVGSAVCVAVVWASFLGCLVPILCRRLSFDPAIVAGPFLITLSDVSGCAIFMGVAHLVLVAGAGAPGA